MMLGCGTAPFRIETGRWKGVSREESVCKECGGPVYFSDRVKMAVYFSDQCYIQQVLSNARVQSNIDVDILMKYSGSCNVYTKTRLCYPYVIQRLQWRLL